MGGAPLPGGRARRHHYYLAGGRSVSGTVILDQINQSSIAESRLPYPFPGIPTTIGLFLHVHLCGAAAAVPVPVRMPEETARPRIAEERHGCYTGSVYGCYWVTIVTSLYGYDGYGTMGLREDNCR